MYSREKQPLVVGITDQYPAVFGDGLGTMNTFKPKIRVQYGPQPNLSKPYPVPFALRRAIDMKLTCLEEARIVKKCDIHVHVVTAWAALILFVPRNNGKVNFCDDHKVTVNLYVLLCVDQHAPLLIL